MELVLPKLGLFLWTLIIFGVLFLVMRKFAWGAILTAIHDREKSIEESLKSAEAAKLEMAKLNADNEALLKEARAERDKMLKEANDIKAQILAEAKTTASKEAAKIIEEAKATIQIEKMAALTEMKNTIGLLSIDIAEKVLKKKLENTAEQNQYITNLISDIKLN